MSEVCRVKDSSWSRSRIRSAGSGVSPHKALAPIPSEAATTRSRTSAGSPSSASSWRQRAASRWASSATSGLVSSWAMRLISCRAARLWERGWKLARM